MTATHTAAFQSAIIPNDVLEGRIHAPSFDVQLHLTRWPGAGEGVFKPSMQFIEMQLSPPKVSGTYVRGAPASAYADLSEVTFVPQGQPLYCRITPGLQRCISCMFDIGALSQRSAMEWNWPEFDPADALTIRNEYVRLGMRRVAEEVLAPGFAASAQIECLLLFVALELRRHLGNSAEPALSAGRLTTRQLALLRSMVVDGPGEIPSIGVLAAACGMGGRQLAASYRKTTGVTLRSFLASASLDRAKNMLLDRSTLIKQVAFDSGFQSSAAFTAAFRKSTGRTPVEYRAAMAAPRLS
jgi:AraC family transcriptional regulator